MKNRNCYISGVIRSAIIVIILFWIFFHNVGIARFMILPFIACGLFSIGKNICLFIQKKEYAIIFNKLFIISFLIFWFGFLIVWSYLVSKEKNYFLLLFTIPFWIAGIYIIRNYLLEIKSKKVFPNKRIIFNFKKVVSSILVSIILLLGVFCLFIGIKETYQMNKITKNYAKANGYLIDYEMDKPSNNKKSEVTTYLLIYEYEVDGKKYTISTNDGVEFVPEKNNVREIKYNPSNPEEAVIMGTKRKNILIYLGIFFILGSMAFILGAFYIKGYFDKIKIDIMGLYLGLVFLTVGIGIILFQKEITSSFWQTIQSLGGWAVLPIIFILVGIFQIIKCFFLRRW